MLKCSRALVLLCIGALVLMCSGAAFSQGAAPPRPGAGLIAGQVVDAGSGRPIAGVNVALRAVERATVLYSPVKTDADGRFAFERLSAGSYTISATAPQGFVPGSAFVQLATDARITDVTMPLAGYGVISGSVRDGAGDPVVGMRVDAHVRRFAAFRPLLVPRGGARTDDRGEFRIAGLPPGEYLVCACERDPLAIDKRLLPTLGAPASAAGVLTERLDSSVPVFAPTFPPDSTRAADAAFVRAGYPDPDARVDIIVRSVTPRRVSGQLIGIGGSDLTKWTVLLIPENERPEMVAISAIKSVRFTPKGEFQFVAVPPGRYSLEAFEAAGTTDRWGSLPVEVGDADITGLVVPMAGGAAVSGRLEFSGRAPRPDAGTLGKSTVSLVPADLTFRGMIGLGTGGTLGHRSTISPDGTFRIDGVPPGRYIAMAGNLGPGWTLIDSVRSGPDGSADRIVTVGPLGLSDVVVTMTDAPPASLTGTVVLDKYESPQSLRVLLFPSDPATWSEPARLPERFVLSPIRGNTFQVTGVPPGDYFVALPTADQNIGLEHFEQWSRTAPRVTLREGQTTKIEVRR